MSRLTNTADRLDIKERYDGTHASYDDAVAFVLRWPHRRMSTALLQRYLDIGYNRSALWLFWMEADGIVGPIDNDCKRDVLAWRH